MSMNAESLGRFGSFFSNLDSDDAVEEDEDEDDEDDESADVFDGVLDGDVKSYRTDV